jgi:hypothetical protein
MSQDQQSSPLPPFPDEVQSLVGLPERSSQGNWQTETPLLDKGNTYEVMLRETAPNAARTAEIIDNIYERWNHDVAWQEHSGNNTTAGKNESKCCRRKILAASHPKVGSQSSGAKHNVHTCRT